MNDDRPISGPTDEVDQHARDAALWRLHDLYCEGRLSHERFCGILEQVYAASGSADLEAAMSALPPMVHITPASLRLAEPLVVRAPDGGLHLGAGWQLAADTTVSTGFGTARLDLSNASWDAQRIDLHLETWGSIEVLVPRGVAVQMAGGSGRAQVAPLSAPVPGGPVLRISTAGVTGVIRIRHPKERSGGPYARWRRQRSARGPAPRRRSRLAGGVPERQLRVTSHETGRINAASKRSGWSEVQLPGCSAT